MTETSTTKAKPKKIVATVVGAVVAGLLAISILLVVAITFLGEEQEPKFQPVGEPLSAPAPDDSPTRVLPIA